MGHINAMNGNSGLGLNNLWITEGGNVTRVSGIGSQDQVSGIRFQRWGFRDEPHLTWH